MGQHKKMHELEMNQTPVSAVHRQQLDEVVEHADGSEAPRDHRRVATFNGGSGTNTHCTYHRYEQRRPIKFSRQDQRLLQLVTYVMDEDVYCRHLLFYR